MDDVAGQYADWQDRQERSNRTIEECIEDSVINWLDIFLDGEFGVMYTRPQLRDKVQELIEVLKKDGFEITIRKEVSK